MKVEKMDMITKANQVIADEIIKWKEFLQVDSHLDNLILKSIDFEHNNERHYLVPFSNLDLKYDENIDCLMRWRATNQHAFPTRFHVTFEGTKSWLESAVLKNKKRVLFWITNSNLQRIGHLGIVLNDDLGAIEIDNVVRGEKRTTGLMTSAMLALEEEIEKEFSVSEVILRVLNSNSAAVAFYKKLGYKIESTTPLIEVYEENSTRLIEGSPAIDHFLLMKKILAGKSTAGTRILTAGPSVSGREAVYTYAATKHGWNNRHSDFLRKFESYFAEYVGAEYALATSSCTGALHLSLLSLGVGPGDEVIVPDVTWVATASAVMYTGAKPVFAEVDRETWMMDPSKIEDLITSRTKAIIPVHLYGYGAPIAQIIDLSARYGIAVIEDAAPAIGTNIDGKKAGTFGSFGCFSFQGAKLLVTGEGGMLVTNDKTLYEKAWKIQDHGRKPGTFWIEELGYKYKMNNVTAALGLAQIERVNNQIYRKQRINRWYLNYLADIKHINFQREEPDTQSICWMTSFTINEGSPMSRNQLIDFLSLAGIDSRPVFPAISQYPIWGYKPEVNKNALFIGESGINLPSGVNLAQNDVIMISRKIREAFQA